MKLRCTSDSVRLRLRKSELAQLGTDEEILEEMPLPSGERFAFGLKIDDSKGFSVNMVKNVLVIALPRQAAIDWISSDQVSLETDLESSSDKKLSLLIEKDFPCKEREGEDKSDTFWELAKKNQAC